MKPLLKAFGWAVLFLAVGLILTAVVAGVLLGAVARVRGISLVAATEDVEALLIAQTVAGLVVFGGLTWLLGVRVLKLTAADLRWAPVQAGPAGFARGLGLGGAAAIVAVGLAALFGGTRLVSDSGGLTDYLVTFGGIALLLLPAALFEELVFRGVAQVVLARVIGRWRAVALISTLFALAHVKNPNTTALGLVNIGLAGAFLGAAFYMPGGIWTAWGAHLGWNAALAGMEAPVSGLPIVLPMVDYRAGSPDWVTGGAFGPEGGLTASVAIAAFTWMIWRRVQRTKEQA